MVPLKNHHFNFRCGRLLKWTISASWGSPTMTPGRAARTCRWTINKNTRCLYFLKCGHHKDWFVNNIIYTQMYMMYHTIYININIYYRYTYICLYIYIYIQIRTSSKCMSTCQSRYAQQFLQVKHGPGNNLPLGSPTAWHSQEKALLGLAKHDHLFWQTVVLIIVSNKYLL